MEITDRRLDPLESLRLIEEVISQTKENLKYHSFIFLLWGWLLTTASILFYLLHTFTSSRLFFLPFPVLVSVGIIVSLVKYLRREQHTETYVGHYLKSLWLVLGISFIVVVFINVVKMNPPFTYTLLIFGIGTMVSGFVLRFKPLVFGGAFFLILCIASVFTPDIYKPLLQAAGVIAGYLVPGYLLKYKTV